MLIGDYIHYTAKGYNDYGIYRKQKGEIPNFTSFANTELDKIKLKNINAKSLENDLNQFFQHWQEGKMTSAEQKIIEEVFRQMQQEFGKKLGSISPTGDVTMSDEQREKAIGQIKTAAKKDRSNLSPATIMGRISKLERVRDILKRDLGDGVDNIDNLTQSLNQLKEEANALYGELINEKSIPTKSKSLIQKENILIAKINQLIKIYAAMPAVSLQKGEFFEYLVAYMSGVSGDIASKNINKAINEINQNMGSIKIGGVTAEMKIDTSNFGIRDDTNELHNINFSDNTDMSIKYSQQKVDVVVKVGRRKVGASLKNVNLSSGHAWVHTVSGSNLLYFLQDMAPEFVNHFLNLNATHKRNSGKINESERLQSRLAMKKVLAAKALTGATFGRESAELFIINDNKTGKVKVLSMKKLVQALKETDSNNISVKLGGRGIVSEMKLFNNTSVSDDDILGLQRISNLLSSLRGIKLNASLNSNFILNA